MSNKFKWNKINQELAYDLFLIGDEVYCLYEDGSESLIRCIDDIVNHHGEYAIEGLGI